MTSDQEAAQLGVLDEGCHHFEVLVVHLDRLQAVEDPVDVGDVAKPHHR